MDERLLYFFNTTLAAPWLDVLLPLIGTLGLALGPALGVALAVRGQRSGDRRLRQVGLALLAALLLGLALTLLVQYTVLRPRPVGVRLVGAAPNFPSFPSGHAMAAAAMAVLVWLAFGRRWGSAALGLAAAVAVSRVYQGHHYPSDVLGGALLGAGLGAAAYGLFIGQRPVGRWLLWPQLALIALASELAYLGYIPAWVQQIGADKLLHFGMFGLVAFWLHQWLAARAPGAGWRWAALAVAVPFSAALAEELAQTLSPYRTFDLLDLASDLGGMLVCVAVSAWLAERGAKRLRAGAA